MIEELLDAHPDIPRDGFTLANYTAAASWVASRSFGVDDLHGVKTLRGFAGPSVLSTLARSCHNRTA